VQAVRAEGWRPWHGRKEASWSNDFDMGIRGLQTAIGRISAAVPSQELEAGDLLLIDGSGWCYHLVESGAAGRRELGGDYSSLDAATREAVTALRDEAGLRICVYR
jgi:hypothetical protein